MNRGHQVSVGTHPKADQRRRAGSVDHVVASDPGGAGQCGQACDVDVATLAHARNYRRLTTVKYTAQREQ
jgi:hypothetical protein